MKLYKLIAILVLIALAAQTAAAPRISPAVMAKVKEVGGWAVRTLRDWAVGKGIDYALCLAFTRDLEGQIPPLVEAIPNASGAERAVLEEQLSLVRDQLAVLEKISRGQAAEIAQLQADQDRLSSRIGRLETRVAELEGRVDDLDARVSLLEEAIQSECLDLRSAPSVGPEGFRVKGTPASILDDQLADPRLSLSIRLSLDSCTAQLTQRGLLIQLSMITRGLDQEMSLYATFKHLGTRGFGRTTMNHMARLEYPLSRPAHRVDGQVTEIFIPYAEMPFPEWSDRFALALVVTHDGGPLYVLSDRVVSCVFGQRVNCRWDR